VGEEVEVSDDKFDELDSIAQMLIAAAEYGLDTEVVYTAMRFREEHGCTIAEACTAAMVEWDL
jgi:hypothetical protein